MLCGTATASHTVKIGKYKGKLTNKQYNKLKKNNKNGIWSNVKVKCTNKKGYKISVESGHSKTKYGVSVWGKNGRVIAKLVSIK